MSGENARLAAVFEGWEGYNTSLLHAIEPLSREHLLWRPDPGMACAGEVAAHIAFGRIDWFSRMGAPGVAELHSKAAAAGARGGQPPESVVADPAHIVQWMSASWQMIADNLSTWTIADLWETYTQEYRGTVYAVSRQWTIWRILAHDIQHGGQLTILLGMQGIPMPELRDLGGHLTVPPIAVGG